MSIYPEVEKALAKLPEEIRAALVDYQGKSLAETRTESVTVFRTCYDSWPMERFSALIAETIANTPEEFRKSLTVEAHHADEYDDDVLTIEYERPETPQEVIARIQLEINGIVEREHCERREYAALKAKYGP